MNLGGVIALAVLAAQVLEDQEAAVVKNTNNDTLTSEEVERRYKYGSG